MKSGNPISAKALSVVSEKATVTIALKDYVDLAERALNADMVRREKTRMFFFALLRKMREHEHKLTGRNVIDFLEKRWEFIYDDERENVPLYPPLNGATAIMEDAVKGKEQ